MNAKRRWRDLFRRRLLKLAPRVRAGLSLAVRRRTDRVIRDINPRRVFAFAATFGEPDLWPLYRKLLRRTGVSSYSRRGRVTLAFPKVRGRRMEFYTVRSLDSLRPGAYRILEPIRGRRAGKPRRGDLILVPCLGFDARGRRLGHGGGYFDRWLASGDSGVRVGIAFHVQMAQAIPHTSRDETLDGAVTDRGVFWFSDQGA